MTHIKNTKKVWVASGEPSFRSSRCSRRKKMEQQPEPEEYLADAAAADVACAAAAMAAGASLSIARLA